MCYHPPMRSTWKLAAKLAVSAGLVFWVLRVVDFAEIGRALAATDPALLCSAFVLYLAGQAIQSQRWRMLARAAGFDDPPGRFLVWYSAGTFFNVFGLGTVGGDLVRGLYLAGRSGRRVLALNTVVADRVSGLIVLLAIALVSLLVFREYDLPAVIYWTIVAVSAALLAGWQLAPRLAPLVLAPTNPMRRLVEQDLAPYWNDGALVLRVAAVALVFHLAQIGVLMLLAAALGLELPWSYFFVFGPVVNVLSSLPISIGGIGVREMSYVFFLTHVGLDHEPAVAFALLWFGLVLASGLVGGGVYLALGRMGQGREGGFA